MYIRSNKEEEKEKKNENNLFLSRFNNRVLLLLFL